MPPKQARQCLDYLLLHARHARLLAMQGHVSDFVSLALQDYIAADVSLAGVGFMARVAVHVGIGASSLGMVLLGLYRTEGDLLLGIRQMRKTAVS